MKKLLITVLSLYCMLFLTPGIVSGQTFNHRIGVSSDGNQHDPDDIGNSAWSVGMIACAGAQYVHHDYANHLGDNDPGQEAEMIESVIGAAERFIGDVSMTFNCQNDLQGAIANIAAQINASSANDRFYYCLGGPMEVPWRGIMAADPDKRQFCTVISHTGWNDAHDDTPQMTHTWSDIITTGVEYVHISDQNINLQENDLDYWWSWSSDNADPNIVWLDSRRMGGDISDAGMVYFVVTGLGNQSGTPHDVRDLFAQGYSLNPQTNFEASATTISVTEPVTFTATGATGVTSWSWNFGAGANPSTASGEGPHTITYSTDGTKTVSLSVDGDNGPQSIVKDNYLTVYEGYMELAYIDVTPTSATVMPGQTLQFETTGRDLAGHSVSVSPTWSVTGGGSIDASGVFTASTLGGPFTVTATDNGIIGTAEVTVANMVLVDDFNRPDNGIVGNGWIEFEGGANTASITGNALVMNSTDGPMQPLVTSSFSTQSSGEFVWRFDMDWQRTGGEGTYEVLMQLGENMNENDLASGAAVYLRWGDDNNAFTTEEGFGYISSGGGQNQIATLSEPAHIEVTVNLDQEIYDISIDGAVMASDVPFQASVTGINEVRFLTNGVNTGNFAGRSFDNIEITGAGPMDPPVLTTIDITPASISAQIGETASFSAQGYDQYGSPIASTINWSVSGGGTIDNSGLFTAETLGGPYTVTASSGAVSGTAQVTVTEAPVLTSIDVTPLTASIEIGSIVDFAATPKDQFGNAITGISISWSVDGGGTIDANGIFTAGTIGGPYTVTASSVGVSGTAQVTVTDVPLTGVEIPALIQAEDYTDMLGIQLEGTGDVGGGQNVGWIEAGDWLEYEIYVPSTGTYNVDYRVASLSAGGQFTLSSEGTDLHTISFPATGGWQSWTTVSGEVSLVAGSQIIRITADQSGWNINWLEFTSLEPGIPVTGVTISPTTVSINEGTTTQLTATVSPSDATNQSVSWSSSNSAIATVDANGLVTGILEGNATITATTVDGGFTATCAVTVNYVVVPVTGVSVSPTSEMLQEGATTQLTASVSPANATNQSVSWSSDNEAVATVNSNGLVTAISEGAAAITVTTADGGFIATSDIAVTVPTGCIVSAANGDFSVEVTNDGNNPSVTFVPGYAGVGDNIVILYYKVGNVGTFPGYIVQPNVPYQINANTGDHIYLYYTYSLPTGGERNSAANKNDFIVGQCGTTLKASDETSIAVNSGISVYPNPATDYITIELNGNNYSMVSVYNVIGEQLVNQLITETEEVTIDINAFSKGTYLIKLVGESRSTTELFLID